MTKSEEMKRFEADMASDKELREKFYKTVDRIAGEKTAQSDGELFAKAASELGYSTAAADFERLEAEKEEVNAEELKNVAGGSVVDIIEDAISDVDNYRCNSIFVDTESFSGEDEKGHDNWCLTAWHCLAATLHTQSDNKDETCWKDYKCIIINKK